MKIGRFKRLPKSVLLLLIGVLLIGPPASVYADPVGTTFTYQGNLADGGSPASGPYDFEFKLFDAATLGAQVGSTVVKEDVEVADGFFSVELDFGNVFSGEARYLEIGVRPGADTGAFNTFTTRQALTAAPYALGLQPGAVIEGNIAIALSGISTSNSSNPVGVYGEASGSSGRAVFGNATSTSGANAGVRGETPSTNSGATGVFGLVSSASATGAGVKGQNNGSSGYGVWGNGGANAVGVLGQSDNNYGVWGISSSNTAILGTTSINNSNFAGVKGTGPAAGVIGQATGTGYGVQGTGSVGVSGVGTGGPGIYGQSDATSSAAGVYGLVGASSGSPKGVQGVASATSGATYGVHGSSASGSGFGVYGANSATTGAAWGVYGTSASPTGFGVYGINTATSGLNYGVYGYSTSSTGYGVVGEAQNYGVRGYASLGVGVTGAGETGVYGGADSNIGVLGQSNRTNGQGVVGQNYASTGVTYGVKGLASSASGYAGFFVNSGGGNLLAANNADTTTDLEFRVDSNGNVYADGGYNCGLDINAGGDTLFNETELDPCLRDLSPADFAEMLPAATTDQLEPADVLVIGPDGALARSSQAYQPTVVGIYSTRPSYLGNSRFANSDGYAPLALVGIVPVKASAENGPIQPGDMLVAAGTPGHAMKAGQNPPQGTVIGKALAELEAGAGVIQMLVTLQ